MLFRSKEYPFYHWLVDNNIGGIIYSLTEIHESTDEFNQLLPYWVFMVSLVNADGSPIDMEQFHQDYQDNPRLYHYLQQIVRPRKTFMATDEALRDDQPKISDRVEFVFRRVVPDDQDSEIIPYLIKARRVD